MRNSKKRHKNGKSGVDGHLDLPEGRQPKEESILYVVI